MKKRMIFGVIGAEVNGSAQREIIKGIIKEAQLHNIDTAVISNTYNLNCWDYPLPYENQIYELILSEEFDGLIVLSEPFRCDKPRAKVREYLLQQKSIPIIVCGAFIPDFDLPNATSIDTNDESDIEYIADHFIDDHGFTNIEFLTGPSDIHSSQIRLNGYKKSLKKHGIPFDSRKVIFGDFWMSSGRKLANEYISGQRPYPEAVMCANDYMAYGLLDEFAEKNIDISKYFAVTGYDYAWNRYEHSPLLTTYQRNREQLGKNAVRILLSKLQITGCGEIHSPKGLFKLGTSCFCNCSKKAMNEELQFARMHSTYEQWNLLSQMNQQLTECHNLKEFIELLGSFQYLVRNVENIFLCLFDGWHKSKSEINKNTLICRSIVFGKDNTPFQINQYYISEIFQKHNKAAVYYFNPLHFKERLFGYIVLKYNSSDVYDDIYRNWITYVANGLEFLRMKHDINYLMQCQSMTENFDSLTSLRNDSGMKKVYELLRHDDYKNGTIFSVMLKTCLFHDNFNKSNKIQSLLDITDALLQITNHKCDSCGRIDDSTFLLFVQTNIESKHIIADKLESIITQHKTYISNYGMDSYVYSIFPLCNTEQYNEMKQKHFSYLTEQIKMNSKRFTIQHYEQMLEIRNLIYLNPKKPPSTDEICRKYTFSPGHLRTIYKNCFKVSFHQDCIRSRISLAKYLLYTTNIPIASVADQCGYEDDKYFLRQFQNCIGMTPKQFKVISSNHIKNL